MCINYCVAQRIGVVSVILAIVVTGSASAVDSQATGKLGIAPDPVIQSAISDMGRVPDKASFDVGVQRMRDAVRGDLPRFVGQLLYYSRTNAKDAGTKPLVGRILKQLDVQKESLVAALVPHLDNADPAIVKLTRELLAGYEDQSVTRGPDFSAYRAIIEVDVMAGREPQGSLVGFMYESDPGVALRTMVRAMQLRRPEEIKPILWGEHVVAELLWKRQYGFMKPTDVDGAAVEQLEKLSRHERWWVRLYVVSIVKSYPELGSKEMIARFAADANPLVKALISGN
jgi:hypothetical protein